MEYYQVIQNRAGQTAAVITQYLPTLQIGNVDAAGLISKSTALDVLAQLRDDAMAASDTAVNAEHQGFLAIQNLTLQLPQAALGLLDDTVPAESDLLDLLTPVFGIAPRTTELALERAKKLKSALDKINSYLAAQVPPRGPITTGGRTLANLVMLTALHPPLEQAVEDTASDVTEARTALRGAALELDRFNKRFYALLQAEARTNAALAAALGQITTDNANQPRTLGIKSILQGGNDNLHLLVAYDNGSYDDTYTSTLEWQVVGTDADFTHSAAVDPSGNTLGSFAVGKTVKIRSRTTNANGTTTGSIRTLTILPPAP